MWRRNTIIGGLCAWAVGSALTAIVIVKLREAPDEIVVHRRHDARAGVTCYYAESGAWRAAMYCMSDENITPAGASL
jgi:hypothetical protein